MGRLTGGDPSLLRRLHYNNADPYLPDLLICRPELAAATLEALATFEG